MVSDIREVRDYPKAYHKLKARNASVEEMRALWSQHNNIKYTSAELVQLAQDINRANGDLIGLFLKAKKRSHELESQTPHRR